MSGSVGSVWSHAPETPVRCVGRDVCVGRLRCCALGGTRWRCRRLRRVGTRRGGSARCARKQGATSVGSVHRARQTTATHAHHAASHPPSAATAGTPSATCPTALPKESAAVLDATSSSPYQANHAGAVKHAITTFASIATKGGYEINCAFFFEIFFHFCPTTDATAECEKALHQFVRTPFSVENFTFFILEHFFLAEFRNMRSKKRLLRVALIAPHNSLYLIVKKE